MGPDDEAPDQPALPDVTVDESDRGWGDDLEHAGDADDDLERLRREVPPHHGG